MKIIHDYLESLFLNLPNNPEVNQLKADILANMEDKYLELIAAGHSENAAIGQVISEFGNIQELYEELGLFETEATGEKTSTTSASQAQTAEECETFEDFSSADSESSHLLPLVDEATAEAYLLMAQRNALKIAFGVLLCIFGVCGFFLVQALFAHFSVIRSDYLGIICLLLAVILALPLFITAGFQHAKFEFLERPFRLPQSVQADVIQQKNAFQQIFTSGIIGGIVLIGLGILSYFICLAFLQSSQDFALTIMLFSIGIGVFLLVFVSCIKASFNRLLTNAYDASTSTRQLKNIAFLQRLEGIYWPLVVIIYLLFSYLTKRWDISWLIWPVAALFFECIESFFGKKA